MQIGIYCYIITLQRQPAWLAAEELAEGRCLATNSTGHVHVRAPSYARTMAHVASTNTIGLLPPPIILPDARARILESTDTLWTGQIERTRPISYIPKRCSTIGAHDIISKQTNGCDVVLKAPRAGASAFPVLLVRGVHAADGRKEPGRLERVVDQLHARRTLSK
eukprot:4128916-Pleurochrysis_carterae.AAC.1